MGFMEQQVTTKQRWLKVEATDGTTFVNVFDTGLDLPSSDSVNDPIGAEKLADYVQGEVDSWENIQGYGARLSAPGYLDCTEWSVFDTAEEAQEYLDEYYPDDEDEDEDEVSA